MNKEMLNTLEELSKKETTDLALTVMELTADNLIKDKEIQRLNNIIDELEKNVDEALTSKDGERYAGYYMAYNQIKNRIKELKEGK